MRTRLLLLGFCLLLGACGDEQAHQDMAVQGIYSGTLSADGRFALIGSINHGASFWDGAQRLYNWNHQGGEYSLISSSALSGNGAIAATTDHDRGLVFWNAGTGKSLGYWQLPADANSIALDQTGQRALIGLANHQVLLFDRRVGVLRVLPHEDIVNAVALTPDGRLGLSGADDQQAKLWDLERGVLLERWDLGHKVVTVALSDDGRYQFAAAQSRSGHLFARDQALATLGLERQTQSSARFSADGQQLLTGSSAGDVYLWSVPEGQRLHSWHLSRKDVWKPTGISVRALAFAGGQRFRALASNGRSYELEP